MRKGRSEEEGRKGGREEGRTRGQEEGRTETISSGQSAKKSAPVSGKTNASCDLPPFDFPLANLSRLPTLRAYLDFQSMNFSLSFRLLLLLCLVGTAATAQRDFYRDYTFTQADSLRSYGTPRRWAST